MERPVRFVFLSDLHEKEFGRGNQELLKQIDAVHPDFVLLGGDLIVCRKERKRSGRRNGNMRGDVSRISKDRIEHTISFLTELKERYPLYCGMGNHEERLLQKAGFHSYKELCEYASFGYNHSSATDDPEGQNECLSGQDQARKQLLRLYSVWQDIHMLDDTSIRVGQIEISGITLPMPSYRKLLFRKKMMLPDALFQVGKTEHADNSESEKSIYRIAMVHNPLYAKEALRNGHDLVLCGHVHGGTIRLPYIGALMTPQMKFFYRECAGWFRTEYGDFIVNRGLGTHSINIRINDLPEISVITIQPDTANEMKRK